MLFLNVQTCDDQGHPRVGPRPAAISSLHMDMVNSLVISGIWHGLVRAYAFGIWIDIPAQVLNGGEIMNCSRIWKETERWMMVIQRTG